MQYAFIDRDSIVVNIITGPLPESQHDAFLKQQATLFSAIAMLEVPEGVPCWIGGMYDSDAGFQPPVEVDVLPDSGAIEL